MNPSITLVAPYPTTRPLVAHLEAMGVTLERAQVTLCLIVDSELHDAVSPVLELVIDALKIANDQRNQAITLVYGLNRTAKGATL